uniref:Zinc finger PHD-type domain-containing protein n=2 Tax=Lutzomyia longipalpis TaxID=7200 RepID=A0A1B0GKS8_LUTLO
MACIVCKMEEDDETVYGEMKNHSGITCHHFCLLFSEFIPQRGKDDEGIDGFLCKDIQNGAKKAQKIMKTYCHQHTGMPQNPPEGYDEERFCSICFEPIGPYHPLKCIQSHCKEKVWMHSSCLRPFALEAGYGFKCLLCRSPDFRENVMQKGIYVPNRDIQWMLNQCEGRSQDPSAPLQICGAKVCKSTKGRVLDADEAVGGICGKCHRPFHGGCVQTSGHEEGGKFTCSDCDERELEAPEEVEVEEKNQEFVPMPGNKRMKIKKYVADVHSDREKVVTDEAVSQPGFHHGPRQAKHAQFRLNYFLNSF